MTEFMEGVCVNANVNPKTIFTGDNLPIMRGMNSESVDLIYLDPPFNSNANYATPIGSAAAGAEFKDTWTLSDVDNAWLDLIETKYPALNRVIHAAMTNSDKSYLIYIVKQQKPRTCLFPRGFRLGACCLTILIYTPLKCLRGLQTHATRAFSDLKVKTFVIKGKNFCD